MELRFNQEILVPGNEAKRRLLEFENVNITSDLLGLEFEYNDLEENEPQKFNATLLDWQPTKILIGVFCEDINTIARGKLIVKIKNPENFVSRASGIVMDKVYAAESIVVFPP